MALNVDLFICVFKYDAFFEKINGSNKIVCYKSKVHSLFNN